MKRFLELNQAKRLFSVLVYYAERAENWLAKLPCYILCSALYVVVIIITISRAHSMSMSMTVLVEAPAIGSQRKCVIDSHICVSEF